MKVRFFSTVKKPDPDPVASRVYRQLAQTITNGLWRVLGYQSNPKNMKSAAELAAEARRQRLLLVYSIVASGIIVCVLLYVMVRLLQRPKPFVYPNRPNFRCISPESEELREDVIDSIDRAVAGCGIQAAKQQWKNLTKNIKSLEDAFTQFPHSDCECVDKVRGTPSLFHLLLHVDENEANDILTKLHHLSDIIMRNRSQGMSSKESSRPKSSKPTTRGGIQKSTWKKLLKLKVGLAHVESLGDLKSREKALKKLADNFNKAIQYIRKELFNTSHTLRFDALGRDIVDMRKVLGHLKAFRTFCTCSSSSDVVRCGQFDLDEFFQSRLYEGCTRTLVSEADLEKQKVDLIQQIKLRTKQIHEGISATANSEPESSEAIEKILASTGKVKINVRKALEHVKEADECRVLDILEDPLSYVAKRVQKKEKGFLSMKTMGYAAIAIVASMMAMNGLLVVGINRFR